tara:strand:+ start:131 stop:547 length:417 start_codon:yes stop_codon:yes gene_type:complete
MNPEEKILEHAGKLGGLEANYNSILKAIERIEMTSEKNNEANAACFELLKEEVKMVRHDLANEKLNKEFKEAIVDDYEKLSEKVNSIDSALRTANWLVRNWKLSAAITGLLIIGLTTTTIEFGDKLYKADPPKIHQNP